jgi:hypothetical protein
MDDGTNYFSTGGRTLAAEGALSALSMSGRNHPGSDTMPRFPAVAAGWIATRKRLQAKASDALGKQNQAAELHFAG